MKEQISILAEIARMGAPGEWPEEAIMGVSLRPTCAVALDRASIVVARCSINQAGTLLAGPRSAVARETLG
jgi:hypothetical protein